MPTPLQILHVPSVVRRVRAPQSAPAGHRPTGPGRSRHPPRVHSPGRRYPSLRVIERFVAAEHMSDGRTRARRTSPRTTSMCTTGPALGRAGRPGHERTPRQARRAQPRDPSQAWNLLHWHSTAKGRRSTYGPPESPAPRERSRRPNHPLWASPPSKEAPPAGRHKLDCSADGPATRKQ